MPTKRKKQTKSVYEELDDYLPQPILPSGGYHDEHTHYEKIEGTLTSSHDTVHVPPSPVKNCTAVAPPASSLPQPENSFEWLASMQEAPALWETNDAHPGEQALEDRTGKKRKRTAAVGV